MRLYSPNSPSLRCLFCGEGGRGWGTFIVRSDSGREIRTCKHKKSIRNPPPRNRKLLVYHWLNMLTILIAVAMLDDGPPGYSPYSAYTPMGFGSTPPNQNVAWNAVFTQSAWVSDKDTWRKDSDHDTYLMVPNPNTTITPTFRSGSTVALANESYDPDAGKRTLTWSLRGFPGCEGTNVFVDDFLMEDQGTGNCVDTSQVSHNTVVYPAPSGNGGPNG